MRYAAVGLDDHVDLVLILQPAADVRGDGILSGCPFAFHERGGDLAVGEEDRRLLRSRFAQCDDRGDILADGGAMPRPWQLNRRLHVRRRYQQKVNQ